MKQTLTDKFRNAMYDMVNNLMSRWYDEYEYEDIKDYIGEIEKRMKVSNVKIVKRGASWQRVYFNHPNGNTYFVHVIRGTLQMMCIA
jgi:uracil phosphoribosyltransferase